MSGIGFLALLLALILGGDRTLVLLHKWSERSPDGRSGAVESPLPAPPASPLVAQ